MCRLKDTGHPELWGFALFTYSNERYEDNVLPTGLPFGTPEDALDCACRPYLGDPPSGSIRPRRINAALSGARRADTLRWVIRQPAVVRLTMLS